MDGSFIHNYALGLGDVQCIRRHTQKPLDVHLMVEDPGQVVDIFLNAGVDILYVHLEKDPHITRTLGAIWERGGKAGLALNPGTPLEAAECILPLVDYLLIMTVNPGFAGQKYLPFVDRKIRKAAALKEEYGYQLAVDVFVLGTSLQGFWRIQRVAVQLPGIRLSGGFRRLPRRMRQGNPLLRHRGGDFHCGQ